MPTPSRTSVAEIVIAGRQILEEDGLEGLTLQRVATAVGVRAPSLYKRVDGRAELVRLISNDVALDLTARLNAAAQTGDAEGDIRALAETYRSFALANPRAYALLFAAAPAGGGVDPEINAGASEALLRTVVRVAGTEHALEAARLLVAWAHGFVSMELNGAFRLGGAVDEAFAYGVDRVTAAITPTPRNDRTTLDVRGPR